MKNSIVAVLVVLGFQFLAQFSSAFPRIPEAQKTPGALCSESDADFSYYRYSEKIPYCRRSVSGGLKNKVYRAYGIPAQCRNMYTVDHFLPLSMGGNNSFQNLWPEHKAVKALRQNLELEVFEKLHDGQITQAEALEIIVEAKLHPPIADLKDDGNPCATHL